LYQPSPGQFLLALAVWAVASMAVFAHADRHGNKHATFWGIATFLAAGIAVPVYFIRYWLRTRRAGRGS
jgi:hypothetical protein